MFAKDKSFDFCQNTTMKQTLITVLLAGLICSPLSLAQSPPQTAEPVCASGKLVATFDDDGNHSSHDFQSYRCLLKEERGGYLAQDFYWPSAKRKTDPLTFSKSGLRKPYSDESAKADGLVIGWYENGQKEYEVRLVEGKASGLSTTWHENGQKKSAGQMVNGQRAGLWTNWYENGLKKSEGYFLAERQSGPWRLWYNNGQQAQQGQYADDRETGLWLSWFENGQKASEIAYVDGYLTGRSIIWYRNGKKATERRLINGIESGLQTTWYQNGQKASEKYYQNGKLISEKACDEDGRQIE